MNTLQMNLLPEAVIDRPLFDPFEAADQTTKPAFLEFFAGSGLVAYALKPYFAAAKSVDMPLRTTIFASLSPSRRAIEGFDG